MSFKLVQPRWFEHPTYRLGGDRSIQLSYGCILSFFWFWCTLGANRGSVGFVRLWNVRVLGMFSSFILVQVGTSEATALSYWATPTCYVLFNLTHFVQKNNRKACKNAGFWFCVSLVMAKRIDWMHSWCLDSRIHSKNNANEDWKAQRQRKHPKWHHHWNSHYVANDQRANERKHNANESTHYCDNKSLD